MRVKMKTMMCGPAGNFNIGQVADLEDEQATALVEGGYAEVVEVTAGVDAGGAETADIAIPETAVAPNQKRGKRGHNAA